MAHLFEPAPTPRLQWREALGHIHAVLLTNGLIAFIFAATGPLAVVLSVGTSGGLSAPQLASWVFGVFFFNGLITLLMSWRYRSPLGFGWTMPGTVLVGAALQHLPFEQVLGAYVATSAVIALLAASGWVKRLMSALPMPIVMGMIAGLFLRFGLDMVRGLYSAVAIAAPMVLAYLVLSAVPAWGRRLPPVIGALLAGVIAVAAGGQFDASMPAGLLIARPLLQVPAWSLPALFELVIPLTITVIVIQNGQGLAALRSAGHSPPLQAITFVCAAGSALSAAVGAASTCLTGPSNALMASEGPRDRQYIAALTFGLLTLLFGLFAPTFTGLMLAAPREFIMVLGGLALLRVLQGAFVTSFGSGRFTLGALVTLLVTVTDKSLLNIGAAFWGLVAGMLVSWLLERKDFTAPEPPAR